MTFTFVLKGDPEVAFKRAQEKAAGAGATLTGTSTSGTFDGSRLRGSYTRSGSRVSCKAERKGLLARAVSDSYIQSEVERFFNG